MFSFPIDLEEEKTTCYGLRESFNDVDTITAVAHWYRGSPSHGGDSSSRFGFSLSCSTWTTVSSIVISSFAPHRARLASRLELKSIGGPAKIQPSGKWHRLGRRTPRWPLMRIAEPVLVRQRFDEHLAHVVGIHLRIDHREVLRLSLSNVNRQSTDPGRKSETFDRDRVLHDPCGPMPGRG